MSKDKLVSQTSQRLKEIFNDRSLTPEERGERGEAVVSELVEFWGTRYEESIIENSFIYEQGPILPTTSSAESNPVTESDIVVVTPYRIFVVEVKTIYGRMRVYENSQIEIIRGGEFEGNYESKNFLRQNEMHCRHLYYHLQDLLPDGNPIYIQPIIVMTGKMKLEDLRSKEDKLKYPITITNNLIPTLERYNKPNKYLLHIPKIKKRLHKIKIEDTQRLLNSQKFITNPQG